MIKIINILSYYILLLIGLCATSWIIWSRFLRERVIRDIPDALLTEYRVWLLIYICCIYAYVVKSLLKETTPNIFLSTMAKIISTFVWKPLTMVDHAIKYNNYCKPFYYKFMIRNIRKYLHLLASKWMLFLILIFDIIPRLILVTMLIIDIFYFKRIELFYKIVFFGVLPFAFRYIQYSFADFYDSLVKELTDRYDLIFIFEKGYRYLLSHKNKTNARWHYEKVSVEEYIEILHETEIDNILEDTSYEYEGDAYCKGDVHKKYEQKFNKPSSSWTDKEDDEVYKPFRELMKPITDLKFATRFFNYCKQEKKIKWTKIGIFSMYLICWSYVLIKSYYAYPIDLPMLNYLIRNILMYLTCGENPFIGDLYSLNKNLITIESIKTLILNISMIIIKIITSIMNNIIK